MRQRADNEEVYGWLLGLSSEELERLAGEGVRRARLTLT